MMEYTERILWRVKVDVYLDFPVLKLEFYVQADDIDEALAFTKEYIPAKLTDRDTYAIKPEFLPQWDIDSIEAVWHLAARGDA